MSTPPGLPHGPHHAQPLLVVRPRFIPQVVVASNMERLAYITVGGGSFCSGFARAVALKQGIDLPVWFLLALFCPLVFLGAVWFALAGGQRRYACTEYRFYHDRLEYETGLWTVDRQAIPYAHIVETVCEQGLFQQRYGVGTITLLKPKTFLRLRQPQIKLRDIPNPDTVHTQVQTLIRTTQGLNDV